MSAGRHLLRILPTIDRGFDRGFPSMAGRHLLGILATIGRGFPSMAHECWSAPSGDIGYHW